MEQESKILKIVEKIKTPLSITGLALLVLYLVIRSVLNMDVYEKVGSENTFKILDKIVNLVFVVAIVSLVLGIASYLAVKLKKKGHPQS